MYCTDPLGLGQLDLTAGAFTEVVEHVLMQAGVLEMVGRHLLLALDLHADVKPYRTGHGRLVRPLLCRTRTVLV